MNIFGYQLAFRTIGVIAAIIALAVLAFAVPSCLQKRRSEAAQAKVERAQGKAAVDSGKVASEAQAGIYVNDMAGADLGRDNAKDIRNAEGSDTGVTNAASSAGVRAYCKRAAYRDREQCRLLNAR